jgi:hypothetical protein
MCRPVSRPCGTCAGADEYPALKRRAIVGLSRWDERGRTGRALRNSQFAIRNGQGFFSGFHFGMDD